MCKSSRNIKRQPALIEFESGSIQIFDQKTSIPSENDISQLAIAYNAGFTQKPWDIYGWDMRPDTTQKEFTGMLLTVIHSGGAFILFRYQEYPAAFNIITDMGLFIERLSEIKRYKRLPTDFISPEQYLEDLSIQLGVSISQFGSIAYLSDILVANPYRGKGLGKMLLKTSLEYLVKAQKNCALAWSVNPPAIRILQHAGFNRIFGIGKRGEGIDFLLQGKVWYPTLVFPSKGNSNGTTLVAEHYIKRM